MTRKELVQALEARWGAKAKYLGMPSCAYELKCSAGTFQIDRHGVIRDMAGREFLAEELLHEEDLAPVVETTPTELPVQENAVELPPQAETAGETTNEIEAEEYAVELPLAGHTAASLQNLVNMLASKEKLLGSAFGLTRPFVDTSLAEDLNQRPIEDLALFQTVWTDLQLKCCPGLELDFEKQTLTLKLLKDNPTPDEMAAFRELAVCMNEYAKNLKYSSFKPTQEDNPKYAMRTWLLRLGMSGEAFKTTRKVLLARLSGSAAFRTPRQKRKA